MVVLAFYCCITKYRKLSNLKQHSFIISSWFCKSEGWVLCPGSYKTEIKVSARLTLVSLGRICFPVHLAYWQNPVPCGHKSEVPISLLAVS